MLFVTTYHNKDFIKTANQELGIAYSLMEKLKLGGIGSSRMVVKEMLKTKSLKRYTNQNIDYGNIELRPKGIIIHVNENQQQYSWVIPYHKLHIYNAQYLSFHTDGNVVKFLKNKNYQKNKKFIDKILELLKNELE